MVTRDGLPVHPEQLRPAATEVPAWQKFPPEVTATDILTSLPRFGSAVFVQGDSTAWTARPSVGAPVTNAPVPADYLVGPGDQLAVRNWSGPVEHYSGTVPVTPEGKIYLPLLGELSVGGTDAGASRKPRHPAVREVLPPVGHGRHHRGPRAPWRSM